MTSIRRTALPLLTALLLLGQGPLCGLLCASAGSVDHETPMAAAQHETAPPPCHGGNASGPAPPSEAPEPGAHECSGCDQIAASSISGSETITPLLAFASSPAGWRSVAVAIATPRFAPPDDRAPPRRSLLLRKSSLLL